MQFGSTSEPEFEQCKELMSQYLLEKKEERIAHTRDLSPFIQTRYYRSPEVILLTKDYGTQADIWSVGIVLSEMLRASSVYKSSQKGRFIFKGSSCYPISPANKEDQTRIDADDQLIKILERFP